MLTLARWLWSKVTGFFGLLLPVAGETARGSRPLVFWGLHVLVLAAVLAGLGWANGRFDIVRYVEAPTGWLARVWLPLLALILYANAWAALWLWRLLRPVARPSPFPDLDAAWDAAVGAAERAGVSLARLPVFLIIGRPRTGGAAVFEAARVKATEYAAPGDPPVRLFATKDAVYVAADECSLLGGLAGWAATADADDGRPDDPAADPATADQFPTLAAPADAPQEAEAAPPPAAPLAKDPARSALLAARFRHLCRLLRGTRRPLCPVNGVLVLVPEACTRSPALANQAGFFAAEDLRAAAEVLQVRCPVIGVVCDAEQIPGFAEFLARVPAARRRQRLGRKLPYAARLSVADRAGLVVESVRWQTATLVPRLVYRVMPPVTEPPANARLFQFAVAVHARTDALVRLFTRVLAPEQNEAVLPGGCFFAATGTGPDRQGFLTDVLAQLVEGQNLVAWTAAGLREEAAVGRRTALGYALILAMIAATAGLAVVLLGRR
ncbi:type VI secretion protein IcmF/TssM N-terminal domain-containing protein [Gemmata sp.]|uniref:type VI secretion protein IcmF/TssM N-terminal domain-containing protein n=1 Tax=Gemmata sp. TaxID=1914242 RepID=UPI003F711961